MNNKISSPLLLVLIALLFFGLVLLNNQLFSGVRADLTENQVYSLSDGSKQIVDELQEPIYLYFFFSDKASQGMTQLRNYANRVQSLLEEYETAAGGKIKLQIVDPEPFSEAGDQANQFGLTAATIGAAGDAIYMGLAGRNSLDDENIIAFFDPQQESFLEYEISKLIYQLSDPKPVKVTLLTDLQIAGGQNPMTGRADPPWTFYQQLQQLYEVEKIGADADSIPADTDVLVLLHPQELSEKLQFAIDQYAMSGKNLMAFVDPHHESDPIAGFAGFGQANGSNLADLFAAWGIEFSAAQVLLDAQAGLDIRTQAGGVARHMGFVGFGAEQLDRDDVVTAGLEIINGASFGSFSRTEKSQLRWLPLIQSTDNSGQLDASTYAGVRDPQELGGYYQNDNAVQTLAVRVTGQAQSAFAEIPEGAVADELVSQTQALNAILVGDTDLLTDRFWVSQANFFGQTIFTPFANNGDFITNAVENLGGNNALISIRSRGTFARPFTKVQELEVAAEAKFREQEQLLQQQLEETENQLAQLQNQHGEGGALVITPEQQQAVDAFIEKRIEIRQKLREVRHQLDKDIEKLGSWLKFINIAAAPLVLVLLLMLTVRLSRRQAKEVRP